MHHFQFAFTTALVLVALVVSATVAQQNYPTQQIGAAQGQPASQPAVAQQTVGQGGAGQATVGVTSGGVQPAEGMPVAQQPPFPPLNPQWQQFLDQVLDYWEQVTSKVERYRCDFKRYQFDPSLRADGFSSYAEGKLRYMHPDKGLFRVEKLLFYTGVDQTQKPIFRENERQKHGEYWICDGQYVHIMDQNEKKCTKVELPPQMRGKQIYLSPLPFLFGVKAQEVKQRYWIQPLETPKDRHKEIWLEAYPKQPDDAQNYSRLQIILDQSDFMPKGLIVFLPNFRPNAQHRELYEFEKREVNWTLADRINQLNPFLEEFIPKQPPKDWTIVVEPYQAPAPPENGQPVQGQPQPRVAQPPAANAQTVR